MRILIINNTCGSGWNFKQELTKMGHHVVLITNDNMTCDGTGDYKQTTEGIKQCFKDYETKYFDIIHINAPNYFLIRKIMRYFKPKKQVWHWRGTDARYQWYSSDIRQLFRSIKKLGFSIFFQRFLKKIPTYHLYSTIDLRWYIKRAFPKSKTELFRTPVNTKIFKPTVPIDKRKHEHLTWGKGKLNKGEFIPHNEVPKFLNRYKEVTTYPNDGLSPFLVSVSAIEAAACGCKVTHHPNMDRKWVIKNASLKNQAKRLEKIYKKLLSEK